MLIQTIGKEEPLRVGTREQVDNASSSISQAERREQHESVDKED